MTRTEFWATVNTICQMHRASVTSGYRSEERNKQVGGAPNSRHLTGCAADLVLDDWSKKEQVIKTIRMLGVTVIDESEKKNHLHLHVNGWPPIDHMRPTSK